MNVQVLKGWDISKAKLVAELYEEAFGAKFTMAIPDRSKRIDMLSKSFVPEYSFVAISGNEMVGIAGFQVSSGSLTGGVGVKTLIADLGFFSGLKACLVFSLFERKPKSRELVMDGITVDSRFRGQGIGTHLLESIANYASENDFDTVRLDVVDSNTRARKLYESKGFVAVSGESFPYLKWLIGFSGHTTMILRVKKPANESIKN